MRACATPRRKSPWGTFALPWGDTSLILKRDLSYGSAQSTPALRSRNRIYDLAVQCDSPSSRSFFANSTLKTELMAELMAGLRASRARSAGCSQAM